jgi:hypothetical protein
VTPNPARGPTRISVAVAFRAGFTDLLLRLKIDDNGENGEKVFRVTRLPG